MRTHVARFAIEVCLLATLAGCDVRARVFEADREVNGGGAGGAGGAGSSGPHGWDNPAIGPGQAGSRDTVEIPNGTLPVGVDPVVIDQTGPNNPAGLPQEAVNRLIAGGPPGKLRWLYPYDETVFPAGTLAPTFMWEGDQATEATYLRIKSIAFEYKTVIKPSVATGAWLDASISNQQPQPQLTIPQDIWDTACAKTQGKRDVFTLEITTLLHGVVAGPVVTHFYLAQSPLKGSLYYTNYFDNKTGADDVGRPPFAGTLMRIPPRGAARPALGSVEGAPCAGCHSIAANGSRLTAQTQVFSLDSEVANQAWSYELSPDGTPSNPTKLNKYAAFAALYPDGSRYLTPALRVDLTPGALLGEYSRYASFAVTTSKVPIEAALYDTATAKPIHDTGIPAGALMPMFSPDGKRLVFNDAALAQAHGLAIVDYDRAHDKASNYRELTREPAEGTNPLMPGMRPAWPFFLPDNNAVVFARTDGIDFSGGSVGNSAAFAADLRTDRSQSAGSLYTSDLFIVDVATGRRTVLARAMGFDTPDAYDRNESNLPFGAQDTHHNYSPTVSPVASGGYFWVFWNSVRNYGNLGQQGQLWGAAIDIHPNGSYTVDPSHPAFYVPGQEFSTDNHRAFAALDACRPPSEPCDTGIDCCSGFCSGICTPPPADDCSKRDERCETAGDCCESNDYCINNFCTFAPLL